MCFLTRFTHNQSRVLTLGNLPFVEPMRMCKKVMKLFSHVYYIKYEQIWF